jgi:hypothetical protein
VIGCHGMFAARDCLWARGCVAGAALVGPIAAGAVSCHIRPAALYWSGRCSFFSTFGPSNLQYNRGLSDVLAVCVIYRSASGAEF